MLEGTLLSSAPGTICTGGVFVPGDGRNLRWTGIAISPRLALQARPIL